jgi:diguanylate cyclase (GGDEF)-like protein/PAS domain S-box-containing protein
MQILLTPVQLALAVLALIGMAGTMWLVLRRRNRASRKVPFWRLVEFSPDAVLINVRGRFAYANCAAASLLGVPRREDLIGKGPFDILHPDYWEEARERNERLYAGESLPRVEQRYVRADGSLVDVEILAVPFTYRGESAVQIYARDITQRKAVQRRAERLASLYAALARTAELVARAPDKTELFEHVCRIAVELDGVRLAWVGLKDDAGHKVVPVAADGESVACAFESNVLLDPMVQEGRGPTGTAVREDRVCICNDIASDPGALHWRDKAQAQGFCAVAAFPLKERDRAVGALTLCAMETGFFEPDLVDLLQRMTAGLSFALDRQFAERARSEAQQALAASEHRLAILIGNLLGMVYRCRNDAHWTMEFVSDGVWELTGYRREDLVGNQVAAYVDLIQPEDREMVARRVREALARRERFSVEYRLLDRAGREKWVQETGVGIYDSDGQVEALEGFITDITERRSAEQALRESETRFRSLTALSSDWYWEQDELYRFTFVSTGLRSVGAAEPHEYVGKTRWEVPGSRPPQGGWESHRAMLDRHEPFRDIEYSRTLPDGSVRHYSFGGEPMFDARGRFRGYRGVGREITRQKRAEEDLVRFRVAMELSRDGIFLIDRHTMRYVDVNATACRMFGYTRDELLSMGPADLNPGLPGEELERRLDEAISLGGKPSEIDSVGRLNRRKDGSTFPVEVYRTAIRMGGRDIIVAFTRDITEMKRAREELVRFRAAMDTAADAIFLLDLETMKYLDVTASTCRMLGYSREELLQLGPREINIDFDEVEFRKQYEHVKSLGEDRYELDARPRLLRRRDGSTVPVEVYRRFVRVGDQDVLVAVARDVTLARKAQEDLTRFRAAMETAAEAILLTDFDSMRFLDVNETACRMLGYSREELLQLSAPDVNPDSDVSELRERFERTRALGTGSVVSERDERYLKRKDGTVFPVEIHRRYFRAGDRDMIVSVSHDISERRRAEAALRLRDRAMQASTNAIIITSALLPGDPIEYVNPAFERITGYAADEAIGRNCRFLQGADRDQAGLNELRAAIREGRDAQVLLRNYRKDGTLFWSQLTVSPVRDPSGRITHFVGVAQDITEAVQYREQLEHQANHDALTGLPNRNLLSDRLAQGIAYAQRHRCVLATLFLDLDNFKLVNDTLGHRAGDDLLREIGRRLKACLREDDTVARLGGDEFVLVLNDQPGKESVTQAVHRVVEAVERPILLENQELIGTCSIGISLYPDDGVDGDALLKNADAAMYRAKSAGRNSFQFFSADMNAELSQRLTLEASLRRALEREEFRLFYQPRIGLRSGAVEGLEALIRWQSQEFGLVSPARFIPVAEDTGLIVPIGDWVLHAACRQMRAWHDRGFPRVAVSVNISPRQFRRKELVADVARALEASGLEARYLEIEVTESLVMESAEEFVATLHALKALGVEISVDDFGTGYSSLNYLKRFPVDRLKVDQSFVRDIESDPDDAAIVKAIVHLGHSLGLRVTAEGVETAGQLAFLKRCRCDQAQGYLFSEPRPAEEIEASLRRPESRPARRAARK